MKTKGIVRLGILVGILAVEVFGAIWAHADVSTTATLSLSSYTATADSNKRIWCGPVNTIGCRLKGIVVSSGVAASTLQVYNSSATAANLIDDIDTSAKGYYPFDVFLSTGLTYNTTGTSHIRFLYEKPSFR